MRLNSVLVLLASVFYLQYLFLIKEANVKIKLLKLKITKIYLTFHFKIVNKFEYKIPDIYILANTSFLKINIRMLFFIFHKKLNFDIGSSCTKPHKYIMIIIP